MFKIIMIAAAAAAALFILLFLIYFFNLDMKFMVNVAAPFLEKRYDKRKRKQYL